MLGLRPIEVIQYVRPDSLTLHQTREYLEAQGLGIVRRHGVQDVLKLAYHD